MLSELLEAAMMLSFGAAWPASIVKSWRSRTARGKSLVFMFIIEFGYLCGIMSKVVSGRITYVLIFYFINLAAVGIDLALYYRNRRLDALADMLPGGAGRP